MRVRVLMIMTMALLMAATAAIGQTMTVGPAYYRPYDGFHEDFPAAGNIRTAIDLGNPATATGSIDTLNVFWTASGCSNVFKVKFFHRTGSTLTLVSERGPFTAAALDNVLTLTPPVQVRQGDLIGVSRLVNCGTIGVQFGAYHYSDGFVEYPTDVAGSVDISKGLASNFPLALYGSGQASETVKNVLPFVSSTAVASLKRRSTRTSATAPTQGDPSIRTAVQLFYPALPGSTPLTGKMVFHASGVPGTAVDPSLSYSLTPNRVVNYPDLLAAMGQSGSGSVDFVVPAGQNAPLVIARAYADSGAAGTTGATEDAIDITSAATGRLLNWSSNAYLITPSDLTRSRFDIGVRTLYSGATISFYLFDTDGTVVGGPFTRTYRENFSEIENVNTLLGRTVTENQTVQVSVTTGSAIVYGMTMDTITNDPSIQVATSVPRQ